MSNNHTIFAQMLQTFSRYEFEKAVKSTKTEYHARGFKSWNHFTAMLFGQLSGQDSLRGIEAGLATQGTKLYHMGIKAVHRSTLAYANKHRSHELFKIIFYNMLSKIAAVSPKHKFRFKNPLYSIDATTIDLCLSLYDWAKFRTTKGAVKLHVKLNHAGYIPTFAIVTTGKVHEQKVAPLIPLEKGDVVVFDRGYNNFGWYATLCSRNIYFVTRIRKNADYKVIERRDVSKYKYITSDQTIKVRGYYSKQKLEYPLRRIRSKDPETGKHIVLLTNNFKWSPATISKIYKDRWQIELFFKSLKQQLKVKSFVGTSRNALLSQLWVALIAYLLLSYFKFKSSFGWSLYILSTILPTNLFSRRDIWDWLNEPFHASSNSPPDILQPELDFF